MKGGDDATHDLRIDCRRHLRRPRSSRRKCPQPRASAGPKTVAKAAPADRSHDANDKPIRAAADAFVQAYNAHDAKAIAALFAADGEIVDEAGDARQGRGEIEAVFAAVFDEYPEATDVCRNRRDTISRRQPGRGRRRDQSSTHAGSHPRSQSLHGTARQTGRQVVDGQRT